MDLDKYYLERATLAAHFKKSKLRFVGEQIEGTNDIFWFYCDDHSKLSLGTLKEVFANSNYINNHSKEQPDTLPIDWTKIKLI